MKDFKRAIESDYFFEMFIDDLPMWGFIGEVIKICTIVYYILSLVSFSLLLVTCYLYSFTLFLAAASVGST